MTPTISRPVFRVYRVPRELLERPAPSDDLEQQPSPHAALRRLAWLLVTAAAIVCHGCHGADVDDELCPPLPVVQESVSR